jgi:hypothetical protein
VLLAGCAAVDSLPQVIHKRFAQVEKRMVVEAGSSRRFSDPCRLLEFLSLIDVQLQVLDNCVSFSHAGYFVRIL